MTTALPRACSGGGAISIHAKLLPDAHPGGGDIEAATIRFNSCPCSKIYLRGNGSPFRNAVPAGNQIRRY